jgi:hypothetical protein
MSDVPMRPGDVRTFKRGKGNAVVLGDFRLACGATRKRACNSIALVNVDGTTRVRAVA